MYMDLVKEDALVRFSAIDQCHCYLHHSIQLPESFQKGEMLYYGTCPFDYEIKTTFYNVQCTIHNIWIIYSGLVGRESNSSHNFQDLCLDSDLITDDPDLDPCINCILTCKSGYSHFILFYFILQLCRAASGTIGFFS